MSAVKTFRPASLKATSQGLASFVIVTMGEPDADMDVTLPGYFGRQVVPLVPAHQHSHVPLGKGVLYEDGARVVVDAAFNLDIPAARDWHSAIRFDADNPPGVLPLLGRHGGDRSAYLAAGSGGRGGRPRVPALRRAVALWRGRMTDDMCRCPHCKRCAGEALGIDVGAPLTPGEFRRLEEYLGLAPTGAPDLSGWLDVSGDPAVVEARDAVAEREAAFTSVDQAWQDAAATVREAELLAGSQLKHVAAKAQRALPRLRDVEREALEERDRVWSRTVAARAELAAASRAAVAARLAGDVPAKAAGADAVKDRPSEVPGKVRRAPGVAFVKT